MSQLQPIFSWVEVCPLIQLESVDSLWDRVGEELAQIRCKNYTPILIVQSNYLSCASIMNIYPSHTLLDMSTFNVSLYMHLSKNGNSIPKNIRRLPSTNFPSD